MATEPPVPLGPTEVDLTAAYPPGVAVLDVRAVVAQGTERFALQGFCCCTDLPFLVTAQQQRPTRVDLAALITRDGGESPARAFLRLKNWSSSKPALQHWLRGLRSRHGDDLAVIVRDNTDFAIPWELFWFDDGQDGDWLGSAAILTRWTAIARAEPAPMTLPAATSAGGPVLAYVAPGPMRADLTTMAALQVVLADSLWKLLEQLTVPGDPLGMVYAACHGEFHKSSAEFLLDAEVSVADVDTARFSRLAQAGALVFLNACHSARLIFDPEYNDATLRGFAEAFLRSGAAGFIGTTGAVAEEHANTFLAHLVAGLTERPGRPVARTIRDIRRAAAIRSAPHSNDTAAARALLPFFYTFMYAYFGRPDLTVELSMAGGGPR
jgi:hypothetical protein